MAVTFATADELNSWAGETVDPGRADLILGLVSGAVVDAGGVAALSWTADTVPATVKIVVLRAATRQATNPTDEKSEQIGGYQRTAGVSGLLLTDEERAVCAKAGGLESSGHRGGSSKMVRSCS